MKYPLVSGIIPTHNRSQMVVHAIESMLNQTHSNIEVIVVDDGSSDDTEQVVSAYQNQYDNVTYLKHDIPQGACAARNLGIQHAKGEFIAGLDDDDIWMPDRIEKMLAIYDDQYAFVYSDSYKQKGDKRVIETRQPIVSFDEMIQGENLCGTQILTRKERFINLGGFDTTLPASQDYEMWLRLLEAYGLAVCVNEPLMVRDASERVHRISVNKWKVFHGKFRVYQKHKHKMSRELRMRRVYSLKKIIHRSPSLKFIFSFAPRNRRMKEVRRLIKYKIMGLLNR